MIQEEIHYTQELVRKHLKKMHTAVPGKVMTYYPEKGMCDVQPVMQFKKPNGEWIEYPELKDVPVWWPQTFGQTSTFVYPIKTGDEVLVLLMERPIDYWLFGRQTEQDLMFDLSEAICIPGLFAQPNKLAKIAQDEEAIIIQRQDTFVKIKTDDVIIDAQRDTVINVLRDVTVNAERDVTVNAEQDATLNVERDAVVNAERDITINANIEKDGEEGEEDPDPGIVTINANKEIILNADRRIELNAEEVLINGEGATTDGDSEEPDEGEVIDGISDDELRALIE